MRFLFQTICIFTGVLILAGCNNSSDDKDDGDDTPAPSTLSQIFDSNPNDEPIIFDPDSLQADINQAFGSANDTPVAINSDDTVSAIFQRVQ